MQSYSVDEYISIVHSFTYYVVFYFLFILHGTGRYINTLTFTCKKIFAKLTSQIQQIKHHLHLTLDLAFSFLTISFHLKSFHLPVAPTLTSPLPLFKTSSSKSILPTLFSAPTEAPILKACVLFNLLKQIAMLPISTFSLHVATHFR